MVKLTSQFFVHHSLLRDYLICHHKSLLISILLIKPMTISFSNIFNFLSEISKTFFKYQNFKFNLVEFNFYDRKRILLLKENNDEALRGIQFMRRGINAYARINFVLVKHPKHTSRTFLINHHYIDNVFRHITLKYAT